MPKGVRDSVATSERTSGASAVEMAVPVSDGAAHPGPRQFAVDVAAHGVADRLDVLRDRRFAAVAQAGGIGSERGQRRLQPMGEIGSPAARTLDLALLGVEQRIDLLDQRPNFGRHVGRQMMAAPGSDIGNAATKRVERAQAEADLDRGGNRQHQTQQAERDGEVLGEGGWRSPRRGQDRRRRRRAPARVDRRPSEGPFARRSAHGRRRDPVTS